MSRLDQLHPGGHGVGVPGGAVVQHDDLVALGDQQPGDDRADVAGAADDQRLHRATGSTSRSRCAAISGVMSFTNAPIGAGAAG